MPAADGRFLAIAGVGQETVTAVSKAKDGFVYTLTRHGDGTVPAAAPPRRRAPYFVNAAHSDLTRDAHVASAIVDLLRKGNTTRLPARWKTSSRAQARVSDRSCATHIGKVDWTGLTPTQRRDFLQNLNEPLKLRLRVPAPPPRLSGPQLNRRNRRSRHPPW